MQLVAYLLGLAAVYLVLKPGKRSGRIISAILAFMWIWNGIAYHLVSFTTINKAAYAFGGLFIVQAVLFLMNGVVKGNLDFHYRGKGIFSIAGLAAIIYSMAVYPILGMIAGHAYPHSPMFGIAPCPTTIFTFGLLLLTKPGIARYLLIIPFIWSLIGFVAAINLGITEDIGLLAAGVVTVALILFRERRQRMALCSLAAR
jgi:hypothetical protein